MKNILKFIALITVMLFSTVSCEYDESNYEMLTKEVDANAPFYFQFKNASKSLQTGVNAQGGLVDISTTIEVVLLGTPRTSDFVVKLKVDPTSTIAPAMYTLSATSVTIPAGKTSGSITVKSNTLLMPVDQTLKLVLQLDAGTNNAPAGTTLTYNMHRIKYCPLVLSDLVGSWSGKDSWGYNTEITTTIVNGKLMMNGIGFGWFQDWWGEVIVTNTPVEVDVNLITGVFTIDDAKQTAPYLTATYLGALQPAYKIKATGKITSTCDKIIEFTYEYNQGGYFDGSAWGPKFKETIKRN